MRPTWRAAGLGLVAAVFGTAAIAVGDSFTPVRLTTTIASTARIHQKLPIKVTVRADPGVLDTRTAPLRIEVKLATECGGVFQYTPGVTLLNKQLSPQPSTGRAYTVTARGSAKPNSLGDKTVCVWLAQGGADGEVFASDQSLTVNVEKARRAKPAVAERAAVAGVAGLPPIKHVFVLVLENESESTTFAPNSPAPYLAKTLPSEGAYLPNYYGIGHESNDNYIAMISGQPPNALNQADCQDFSNFPASATGAYGAEEGEGCVYPSAVQTIGTQLAAAGDTWRDYNQSMGNDPAREAAECGHPAVGSRDGTQTETSTDAYATRHDPFVYFHSIIDDTTLCDSHVVNLNLLPGDLAKAADTPNYVFITPDLCGDGHDATCTDPSRPGGFAGIEQFLQQWVPMITGSPAFKQQNGLLIITFDEASTKDTSSCCGEIAGPGSPEPGTTGPGGGDVGAVLLSPCIKPGTVSTHDYNHYTMLRSVEDIFGVPHLGYAQLPGESDFGSDVFTGKCSVAPELTFKLPRVLAARRRTEPLTVRWSSSSAGATFEVQLKVGGHEGRGWRTLLDASPRRSLRLIVHRGQTYTLRIRAASPSGIVGQWQMRSIRVTARRRR